MINYQTKKILVLGSSGMLGNAIFRFLSAEAGYKVFGTVRSEISAKLLPQEWRINTIPNIDVNSFDDLAGVFSDTKPDIVINCIGLVKQLEESNNPLAVIPINALLPHRLAKLCSVSNARLIHISTDCVFQGKKGMYDENDVPDASDLYGRSKYLGEVDYPNAITLRTSIIGHELNSARSLVDWFLSQERSVNGYRRAIFSGLPTVEIAEVIKNHVIPRNDLRGLYHVSADPISKFDLLKIIAEVYGKDIEIKEDNAFTIDRSLNSTKFKLATGYQAPSWQELVSKMFRFK